MNQKDVKEIAAYIAGALEKTGLHIKLCAHRLKYDTDDISLVKCNSFIRNAFEKNQKSPAEAADYLTAVLVHHGVNAPNNRRKEDMTISTFTSLNQESGNSIKEEISTLLAKRKDVISRPATK